MMNEEEMELFMEDDTDIVIPEEYRNMSPEELEKLAKKMFLEIKANPQYPKKEKPVIEGIKFLV